MNKSEDSKREFKFRVYYLCCIIFILHSQFSIVLFYSISSLNFIAAWDPSQKGLLADAPQRHNVTRLRIS
ncbi:hypothetical protein UNH65_15515 [Chitinophaga sp. 180180018-2]|nr:hypothetical protein [Chitinophaga sp. 212800010-3]